MNFVIFPVFFLSGALYPVQNLPTVLHWVAVANPFTYGVDLIKHSIDINNVSADFPLLVDTLMLGTFSILAIAFASWKFSQEATLSTLINKLTGGKR
jgi:ABC-2 type transport system permease protein